MAARKNKKTATKKIHKEDVWGDASWVVCYGELKRERGNPGTTNLFECVAEKIPFGALKAVQNEVQNKNIGTNGVYVAHDSMGCPRYVGRGDIFGRLASHLKAHSHELVYFSFYIVADKKHEREIETLLIRTAGFMLEFNDRKKRVGISPGNVADYEAGTYFFERR
jgi:hypothetical protein